MSNPDNNYKIFNFRKSERCLYLSLNSTPQVPNHVIKTSSLARGTAYLAFANLQKRGLVKVQKMNNKKYWVRTSSYVTTENKDETYKIRTISNREEVREYIIKLTRDYKNISIIKYQSNRTLQGWLKLFTKKEIMELNEIEKLNKTTEYRILPKTYFNDIEQKLGYKWKEGFKEILSPTAYIDDVYMKSKAEVWVYNQCVLIINLSECSILEIKDQDITLLMRSLLSFVYNQLSNNRK